MSTTDPVLASGNVAVITGGASGIGLAVAERLVTNPPIGGTDR